MAKFDKAYFNKLEIAKKKYNVNAIYSWSRYNTFKTDTFEYYLKYIKKVKEDRCDSIYSPLGTISHMAIEELYNGNIKYEEMYNVFINELERLKLSGYKYDRTCEEKNDKISKKYEDCMKLFFRDHCKLEHKLQQEQLVFAKINEFLFSGFVDCIYKKDDTFYIVDWKTSSIYTGDKQAKEGGQLILYSEALLQLGVPLEKIVAQWNFLKYVKVESPQANGKISIRHIERNEIGNKLLSSVKMWMKKKGYSSNDIESHLYTMTLNNSIDYLPDDIKSLYTIGDCYVTLNITQDTIDNLKDDISKTCKEIESKIIETNNAKTEKDKNEIWWQDVTDKDSYRMANLSGYSSKLHSPYSKYLDELKLRKNDIFNDNDDENLDWLIDL